MSFVRSSRHTSPTPRTPQPLFDHDLSYIDTLGVSACYTYKRRGLTRRRSSGRLCSTCWRTCNGPHRSTGRAAGTSWPPAPRTASGRSSNPAATHRPTRSLLPSARTPRRRVRRPARARRRTLAARNRSPPSPRRPPGSRYAVAASSAAGTRRRPPRPDRRTALPGRTAGPADSISGPARLSGCRHTSHRRSINYNIFNGSIKTIILLLRISTYLL